MPDAAPPTAPEPRDERLDTVAAQVAAIDELIGLAQSSVDVFDTDLSGTGWAEPARIDRLAGLLRRRRNAQLRVVVHELAYIERYCARLCGLMQLFGGRVAIRRAGPQGRAALDPLLIVDGRHFLHRFHADLPRAQLAVEQPHAARPFTERFAALWEESEPGLSGSVLGL